MKDILAIIPARGGSKGVPRKNIRKLGDKHLIGYTIEAANKSKYIQRVIVNTDDDEIAEVAYKYGADIPYLRPKELATDNSPTVDAILHMLNYLEETEGYIPKYVALLQCTSPLRNEIHIDEAIEKLIKSSFDAIVSVCEVEENPYWTNIFEDGKLKYFIEEGKSITRRQDLPDVYAFNGAMYIIKTEVLKFGRSFEPENLTGYIMDSYSSIDIDTELDFKIAEIIIKDRK